MKKPKITYRYEVLKMGIKDEKGNSLYRVVKYKIIDGKIHKVLPIKKRVNKKLAEDIEFNLERGFDINHLINT